MNLEPALSGGLPDAVANYYSMFAHTLLLGIRARISSLSDAEDILLETFIALIEHPEIHRRPDNEVLAWLKRVSFNKTMDHFRQSSRRPVVSLQQVLEVNPMVDPKQPQPEELYLNQEEQQQLMSCLEQLPERQQLILRYRFGMGLKSSEIAQRLNLNEGSVRSWLSRAISTLRTLYEKQMSQERIG